MNKSWFLIFLGALALWRIGELLISKANAKRHGHQIRVHAEPLYKWMVLLHTSMFVLLPLELWLREPKLNRTLFFWALLMTITALLLRVWTLLSIGRSWNVRIIGGRDYPICSRGPYRWVRHPNYVVVILELFWIPLLAGLWMSAIFLTVTNAVVLFFRIREEEKILGQNPDWVAKMAEKPRFLPFLI